MHSIKSFENEQQSAAAFSRQSGIFDEIYSGNSIIQYKRKRVWDVLRSQLAPNSLVLELNSGTGEDAVWFARQGHRVHATDIAAGMQDMLREKLRSAGVDSQVTTELRSFTDLASLERRGPYDLIFSNFAGLNCTGDLDKVLRSLDPLLKPGGKIVFVILPSFCLWEFLLLFKGKWREAFRRLFSSKGAPAKVEGIPITCWYYNPSFLKRRLADRYDMIGLEGLCTLVPPSYIENFAEKHPSLFRTLRGIEDKWKSRWPWRSIGDYYISSWAKRG